MRTFTRAGRPPVAPTAPPAPPAPPAPFTPRAAVPHPRAATGLRTSPAGREPDVHEVIDRRMVTTLFQPVVLLSSGAVVGFEALGRGPAGTALESPKALLDAAEEVGRLGELDWLWRTAALRAALDSGLHPSLSWFVNVEAAGLDSACPADLVGVHARARSGLRVVLELTERDVNGQVTALLHAAEQARQSTWGISLDDVGTEAKSLALLPFLQPDVIRLDMRLLARESAATVASITAAVRAHAERSGAIILAEGVEDAATQERARAYGATYGQGWYYGWPGALPDAVPAPRHPVPLRQLPEPLTGETPFELLAGARPTLRSTKEHLMHISEHLEEQGERALDASVLLSCFQRAEFFSARREAAYLRYADTHAYTVAAATGLRPRLSPRLRIAPLPDDSALAQEWTVIVLGPHYAAALAARDVGDAGRDGRRRFDAVYTHDRDLVVRAARAFLGAIDSVPGRR